LPPTTTTNTTNTTTTTFAGASLFGRLPPTIPHQACALTRRQCQSSGHLPWRRPGGRPAIKGRSVIKANMGACQGNQSNTCRSACLWVAQRGAWPGCRSGVFAVCLTALLVLKTRGPPLSPFSWIWSMRCLTEAGPGQWGWVLVGLPPSPESPRRPLELPTLASVRKRRCVIASHRRQPASAACEHTGWRAGGLPPVRLASTHASVYDLQRKVGTQRAPKAAFRDKQTSKQASKQANKQARKHTHTHHNMAAASEGVKPPSTTGAQTGSYSAIPY
jgi:hypothetical protein